MKLFGLKIDPNNIYISFRLFYFMGSIKGRPVFCKPIYEMEVGEEGFTIPSALEFNSKYEPYLTLYYPFSKDRLGYFVMPIKRIGEEKNDYEINMDFKYRENVWPWYFSAGLEEDEDVIKLEYLNAKDCPTIKIRSNRLENLIKKRDEATENQNYEEAARFRDEIKEEKRIIEINKKNSQRKKE